MRGHAFPVGDHPYRNMSLISKEGRTGSSIRMRLMNSRERVIEAINHREPDMLPIDFGGMRSTGINARAYKNLKDYLGLKNGVIKLYDVFQQLAEPEMEVLDIR